MGKIRVRTLGEESLENKQKQKSRLASEAKRAKQKNKEKKLVKGTKGGERVVSVGTSEEEIARLQLPSQSDGGQAKIELPKGNTEGKKEVKVKTAKKFKKEKKASRSKSYLAIAKTLDKSKKYTLSDGLSMLEKLKRTKFDETVELHINTTETGLSGNITLPHGTGKQIRVAIATDELIEEIAKSLPATPSQASGLRGGRGNINFDVLLASPIMMPKLARVAKILGPRGLMPNPKNGTLTKDPQTLALSFAKGQINFRTEAKSPIMHLAVGKMSLGAKKLSENISTLIDAIKKEKIRNITLKSTMSPGIKLAI